MALHAAHSQPHTFLAQFKDSPKGLRDITSIWAAEREWLRAATNALAADHQSGNRGNGGRAAAVHASGAHLMASYSGGGHVARYGGGYRAGPIYNGPVYDRPIYNRCAGYDPVYGGCASYGVALVGGVIDSLLGGYGPY